MSEGTPSDDGRLPENASPSKLGAMVDDAHLLLDHAVRFGLDVDECVVQSIVKVSRLAGEGQNIDESTEVEFIRSLSKLSRKCHPATPFSLRAISEKQPKQSRFFWTRSKVAESSIAGNMLRFYRRSLFLLILVAILGQGIAIFGNAAIRAYSDFEQIIDEYRQTIGAINSGKVEVLNDNVMEGLDSYVEASTDRLEAYKSFWRISYLIFYRPLEWFLPRAFEYNDDPTLTDDQKNNPNRWTPDEDKTALAFTRLWISALSATLVPLIYGFLGANTRVLRRLSADIGSYSLQRNARIAYGLRFSIGGISGLAIGLFVSPDFQSDLINQLSPAALAFLAGYSSELLFSALDRIVGAFTQTEGNRQRTSQ